MAAPSIKHFDYLADHGTELERALDLRELSKNIALWRCIGMEFPHEALVGCRRTLEAALKSLAAPLPDERIELLDLINYAKNEGILDRAMTMKCHEIRRMGNQGAHADCVKAIDAQMALELLDDFLRWNAEQIGLVPLGSGNGTKPVGSVFIVQPQNEIIRMTKRAKLASALDDNKEIDKKAQKVKSQIAAFEDSSKSELDEMVELLKRAEAIGASAQAREGKETKQVLAVQERLFSQCDENLSRLQTQKRRIGKEFDDVQTEIDEILSEHDFIKKLLRGNNRATDKQLEVMAFPRESNSVTNILQIAGSAGTGKTLCLLSKLIAEIDDKGQAALFEGHRKTALFICFNKGLKRYVRGILTAYENALPNIEVAHYDEFINQLVRAKPKVDFKHLAKYAGDARYPAESQIIYGTDNDYEAFLKQAQETVAKKHPDRASDYYLDSSNADELNWLKDEITWIEARFASDEDAAELYPGAARVGRGSKHLPSEAIRRIILEIRQELNHLLEANNKYTIEQATKRLLDSKSLPAYDAIAIDEAQDFSLISIKLLVRFRRDEGSKVFLSGDENQKIYQRDFTWKELDEGVRGHTITLNRNMRNSAAIRRFSNRLLGMECPHEMASRFVHIQNADDVRTVNLLRSLREKGKNETTALISDKRGWTKLLGESGVPVIDPKKADYLHPGLYLVGDLKGKGLEFDNVVVDYTQEHSDDYEEEKRLRYVHFTRARKRLYIRYQGTPPRLLAEYYPDFLG